jgi:uncharacterized protein (DUF1800 family)
VKAKGYSGWLDEQFAVPVSSPHFDWMLVKGFADVTYKSNFSGVDNTLWRKFLSSPDSLPVAWRGFAVAAYVDMLEQRAFGTYRELLEGVSLSCAMGVYLNMRGNTKEDAATGRVPDENYVREVMQLLTIGLDELGINGAPLLDAQGKPKESYTQTNITDLARVLTGWEFDTVNLTESSFMRKPMQHLASRFSTGAKKVLNVDIPASSTGPAALKTVLDTLANHANVGPFIGRQLIQRLVCSNPSPA